MTRSLACFSVSFSLWIAMAGPAAGQAVVETGLGAARAATTAGPAKGIGKSISGLSALDKALKPGQPVSDEQTPASTTAKPADKTTAKPADKTTPTSASTSAASQPNWEDPSGVEPGLGYEELVRRFGPPAMAITNAAERSLTYRGKDGVFQVEVRDGAVTAIVKPHR
jgi:hypothetical protein